MISSEPVWTWLSSVAWDILGTVVHLLLDSGNGWPSPGRQGGQDCEGALISGKAPIGTRHAGPVTASTTQAGVDRSAPRHHGQSYRGSDPGRDGTRRSSQSYRDVEELLAERGITVDHVTIYRWV